MIKTKRVSSLAAILAAVFTVVACATPAQEPVDATDEAVPEETAETVEEPLYEGPIVPLTFQLNWVAGGANAGFAVAAVDGIYEKYGLDVTIVEGNGSGNTAQMVAANQAEIAYADAVAVSQLTAKGAAMRIVGTFYQSNPNAVQALTSSGITSFEDLKGKKVGVPQGSSQATMLPLLWEANGFTEDDIELVNMPNTSMVASLLQGQVDAILGSVDSYAIQLSNEGAEFVEFTFFDYGVPTVSTSIFVSDRFLVDNEDVVKRFIAASIEGWNSALDDKANAVAAVKAYFPETVEDTVMQELKAATPLFCAGIAKYLGKAEPEQWVLTQDLLSQVELLPAGVDPEVYYSNEYLPPDSELRDCAANPPSVD